MQGDVFFLDPIIFSKKNKYCPRYSTACIKSKVFYFILPVPPFIGCPYPYTFLFQLNSFWTTLKDLSLINVERGINHKSKVIHNRYFITIMYSVIIEFEPIEITFEITPEISPIFVYKNLRNYYLKLAASKFLIWNSLNVHKYFKMT